MNTITIERNALCGMLHFAAKKDLRYYLNGARGASFRVAGNV